jgi:hypothetical protein
MSRAVTASVIAVGLLAGVSGMATAEASPLTCERRTASHLAEHGGRYTDDRYHVARGESPSCDNASDRSGSDHNDGGGNDSDDGGFNRHRDRIKPSWRDLF